MMMTRRAQTRRKRSQGECPGLCPGGGRSLMVKQHVLSAFEPTLILPTALAKHREEYPPCVLPPILHA